MPCILLVEDSPTQAQELAFMLEDAGFQVRQAHDAVSGLTLLAQGSFDLVLTDLFLPGDSGIDLCRRIKADPRYRSLPVIVLTRSANPVHLLRGLEAGADDFMTKDNEPTEITGRILRALARPIPANSGQPGLRQVSFRGEAFELGTQRESLLNALLSSFEDLLRVSECNQQELGRRMRAEEGLRQAHADLEQKVQARTAELHQAREALEVRVQERTAKLACANEALQAEIVERQRAEEKLHVLTAELQRSNRELQEFASVASHDLQEPLRKIQVFGDRLRTRCESALDPQGRDYLERMQNAAGRMQRLIEGLLSYSRVASKAQPFRPVDLGQLAREVIVDLEARIQQTGGQVAIEDLPTIDADPMQMRQLLQNLIGNGLKFHRPGESPVVHVEAALVPDPDPSGEGAVAGAACCQLRVRDNGVGFEPKYQDRLFQPFQRLHDRSAYEGTGMGLAICRRIAERHKGSIVAISTPGQGATFLVTLPINQAAAQV